jgi:D-alanine transaminase/branched-chain amino acid aminotransferase
MKENGIKLASYEHQRQLPQVKSTDYIMSIWLQEYLKEQQADDLLYYSNGTITESPRSNFFIVSNEDRVITPADQILKGITRKKVIELASSQFTIEERRVTKEEAYSAREAFITSTTKQIIPVVQVDGKTIGDGLPGSVTKKLMQQLNEACGFSI